MVVPLPIRALPNLHPARWHRRRAGWTKDRISPVKAFKTTAAPRLPLNAVTSASCNSASIESLISDPVCGRFRSRRSIKVLQCSNFARASQQVVVCCFRAARSKAQTEIADRAECRRHRIPPLQCVGYANSFSERSPVTVEDAAALNRCQRFNPPGIVIAQQKRVLAGDRPYAAESPITSRQASVPRSK